MLSFISMQIWVQRLNTLPEIKLKFIAQPGSDIKVLFFPFLLHCVARQAIIFGLDFPTLNFMCVYIRVA